jgi:hypothetical protein
VIPERTRRAPWLRRALPYCAIFAAWAFFYADTLVRHVRAAFNGVNVSDDARIVLVHFLHYSDPELFANDPIGEYHSRGTGAGFFTLYYLAAKLGDPLLLGKLLPYALFALMLAGVFVAARELAGKAAAFTSVALCLGTAIIVQRLAGGLPRAFAYPFLSWMAAALCLGRVRWLAVLSATGGLFYPVLPVIGGLTLAVLLLVMQPVDRGEASSWSFRKRVIVLALTLATSTAALVPFALAMRPYGATIKESMLQEFPEAGPNGRVDRKDRPPFPPFFVEASRLARATVVGDGRPLVPAIRRLVKADASAGKTLLALIALIASIGFVRLALRESNARRLVALGAATFVGYALANAVTPSLVLPQRYAQYAVPVLVAIALPASARGLWFFAGKAHERERRASAVVLGFGVILLCLFGGRGDPISGLHHRLAREDERLFAAVRKLPKRALVAGFPRGALNDLPIATERTAFLTRELHMPYHTGMTLLMRKRMQALIDAYFARDLAPIRRLRDQHQVTHLLVDTRHFAGEPPSYFAPFGTRIHERFRAARGDFAALKARERASVFRHGARFLLDLERLR